MSQNPYEPTVQTSTVESKQEYRYKSLKFISTAIAIGLAVFCLAKILLTVLVTTYYPEWNPIDTQPSAFIPVFISAAVIVISFIWLAVFVTIFTYRANANLRSMGYNDRLHPPEAACVFWFIPIMNLFKPYQEMVDVYSESRRHYRDDPNQEPNTAVIGTWWGFWLGGGFLDRLTKLLFRQDLNTELYIVLSCVSTFSLIVAAVFLVNVVFSIRDGQEKMNGEIVDVF